MKRIFYTLVALLMLAASVCAGASGDVQLILEGRSLKPENEVKLIDGRTFLPLREFSESLGYKVDYSQRETTATIKNKDMTIKIKANSDTAEVNGNSKALDAKAFIADDRIYVPIRFVSEAMGYKVTWDGKNKFVIIGSFKGGEQIEKAYAYENSRFMYSLMIPNAWKDECVIKTDGDVLTVYERKSMDQLKSSGIVGGVLFTINESDKPPLGEVSGLVLDYRNGKYLVAYFPNKNKYTDLSKRDYERLFEDAKKVLATFKRTEKSESK